MEVTTKVEDGEKKTEGLCVGVSRKAKKHLVCSFYVPKP